MSTYHVLQISVHQERQESRRHQTHQPFSLIGKIQGKISRNSENLFFMANRSCPTANTGKQYACTLLCYNKDLIPSPSEIEQLARCPMIHSTKFYLKEVSLHASPSLLTLYSVGYILLSSLDSEVPLLNSETLPDLAWVLLPRCQPHNSIKAVTWASQ